MKLTCVMELMTKHATCPKCGNQYVRNGEGTLIVEDDMFIRTCKCGWSVKETEGGEVVETP
ncbi:hypothetical protein D3C73_362310 [compost metagenome]